jgi:hypothetical protein
MMSRCETLLNAAQGLPLSVSRQSRPNEKILSPCGAMRT